MKYNNIIAILILLFFSIGCLENDNTIEQATPTTATLETLTPTKTPIEIKATPTQAKKKQIVNRVIDGDTIEVNGEKIRLVGVNTPERGEDGFQEATDYVKSRVLGKEVTLDVDDKKPKDKYGRTLAVVYIDGVNLNAELLNNGYAEVMYIPPSEFYPYDWQTATHTATPIIKITSTKVSVIISEAQFDAEGDDRKNLNGEWVELENTGSFDIDISGWKLYDEGQKHTFYFPKGFILKAESTVTIYTGRGTNTNTALYWNSGRPIWNNKGDTATLIDKNGNIIYQYSQ